MTKVYRYQFTKKERDYMIATLQNEIHTDEWVCKINFRMTQKEVDHFKDKLDHWQNNKRGHR